MCRRYWGQLNFQFLLGCYRPVIIHAIDTVSFQFLLGCYCVAGSSPFSAPLQCLSIPFRMLHNYFVFTVLRRALFQFLLGCYALHAGDQYEKGDKLSIPFRMLLAYNRSSSPGSIGLSIPFRMLRLWGRRGVWPGQHALSIPFRMLPPATMLVLFPSDVSFNSF